MTKWHVALVALTLSSPIAADPRIPAPATQGGRMTQGKLAVDLGDPRAAEKLFAGLAEGTGVPERTRAEALVRLGAVQRRLGKSRESAAAFERAMLSPGRDAEVTRMLALAVDGVAPSRAGWAEEWPKLRLAPAATGSAPSIRWPGPEPRGVREAFPARDAVSFDLEDVPLVALLHHLLVAWRPTDKECTTCNWPGPRTTPGFESWPDYQPPADVQRLNVVVHAGVQGFQVDGIDDLRAPRVSVKAQEMPWNELFENVLASNGLSFVLEQGWLVVARAEDQAALERIRGRRGYAGPPISLNFLNGRLADILPLFADVTGMRIAPDAELRGSVTLRVSERPALEVLDMILAANDLTATRLESAPGKMALRIQKLADAQGSRVDLSRVVITP
ncbi:MAG: hypothetical protein ACHP85_09110 [Burkholderiales bacterium]|jgi:hypothetical protein